MNQTHFPYSKQYQSLPAPLLRLYLFGGAGTSFLSWISGSDNPLVEWSRENDVHVYPVQYPEMETDENETGCTFLKLVESIYKECEFDTTCPFAFIGVSMGTWVIYELIKLMDRNADPRPILIWNINLMPPTAPSPLRNDTPICSMSTEEFEVYGSKWGTENMDRWKLFGELLRGHMSAMDNYYRVNGSIGKSKLTSDTALWLSVSQNDYCLVPKHSYLDEWSEAYNYTGEIKEIFTKSSMRHSFLTNTERNEVLINIVNQLEILLLDIMY